MRFPVFTNLLDLNAFDVIIISKDNELIIFFQLSRRIGMKVTVDMDKCQHYGQCVYEAPETFRLNSQDKLEYESEVPESDYEKVAAAADVCPMQAITFRSDK
jgi:ferredoxin